MEVNGFLISRGISAKELAEQMRFAGLQASELGKAVEVIREMKKEKALTILTFTSNMVSSGLRELFADMLESKFIDLVITSIGSVEEDWIKSKKPFLLGDFNSNDIELNRKGVNRIGNILVPNDRYELLEKIAQPFLKEMMNKQEKSGKMISPSEFNNEIGKRITDKNSFLHWAHKNNIQVFCPAPTDGALGLQIYLFKQDNPDFGIDVTGDMKRMSQMIFNAKKTAGIILGGGFAKHHAIGMNILRGGLDYAVYVSTGTEYDGSLSGARVKEAVSWGKVNAKAKRVHVECDASIAWPLIYSAVK